MPCQVSEAAASDTCAKQGEDGQGEGGSRPTCSSESEETWESQGEDGQAEGGSRGTRRIQGDIRFPFQRCLCLQHAGPFLCIGTLIVSNCLAAVTT